MEREANEKKKRKRKEASVGFFGKTETDTF